MSNEQFVCHRCGAQAGIAGDYSDDPDERNAEIDADQQFRDDWDAEHTVCRPPAQRIIPTWTSKVAPRRAKNKAARKSRRINRRLQR